MSATASPVKPAHQPRLRSNVCLKDAFAEQLAGGLLTERYFNLTEEDRAKINERSPMEAQKDGTEKARAMTDAEWEEFKKRRLVSYLGNTKVVGDRMLYAIVLVNVTKEGQEPTVERRVEVFLEREFPEIEQKFTVYLEEGARLPMFWTKKQG